MIRSYIIIAFKNIFKHLTSSIINILGLSIGLSSAFIIFLYVQNEFSFDTNPINKDRIFRVITHKDKFDSYSPLTPYILAPNLENDFAEIDKISRIQYWPTVEIKKEDTYINENSLISAENELFEMFSYTILSGNVKMLLTDPNFIVITKSNAEKYFGKNNPVGQSIKIKIRNKEYDFMISGVIDDIAKKSTLKAGFITSIEFAMRYTEENTRATKIPLRESWNSENLQTYISFKEKINTTNFEDKLTSFTDLHIPKNLGQKNSYTLQALGDIYLRSKHLSNNPTPEGNILSLYIYTLIALVILFIAGVNYIIITISRDEKRNKEMCVRKLSGASRFEIIKQMLTESILISLISMVLAFIIIKIFLPPINEFLKSDLNLYSNNLYFIPIFVTITVLIGIISGSYIAIFLSSLSPMELLKGKIKRGRSGFILKRILITLQIIIFVSLVFCTLVINKQLKYTQSIDLGFKKEGLFIIQSPDDNFKLKFSAFKNEIKEIPGLKGISGALSLPPKSNKSMTYIYKSKDSEPLPIEILYVDHDFIETFELDLIEGRNFSNNYNHDSASNIIVNQAAVKMLGFDDPIGKVVGLEKIIGIVKDFHIHSLHEKVEPVMLYHSTHMIREIALKINPENSLTVLNQIQDQWNIFNSNVSFNYQSFDDALNNLYVSENKLEEIAKFFTIISIIIASMGLFGLSSFVANNKLKEIGIRKVFGSSVILILKRTIFEYLVICLIANIIAYPIAWILMNKWLQNFEYKINIDVMTMLGVTLLSFLIVIFTMSYKTFRAANKNPIDILRYE